MSGFEGDGANGTVVVVTVSAGLDTDGTAVVKMRALIRLLSFLMFASGASFICASSYLQRSLPHLAIQRTGDVVPRNIHGSFVYGTKREWLVYDALFYGMLAFGIPAAFLAYREQRSSDQKASVLRGDDRF